MPTKLALLFLLTLSLTLVPGCGQDTPSPNPSAEASPSANGASWDFPTTSPTPTYSQTLQQTWQLQQLGATFTQNASGEVVTIDFSTAKLPSSFGDAQLRRLLISPLTKLTLCNIQPSDATVAQIVCTGSRLTEFTLTDATVTPSQLEMLRKLPKLKNLNAATPQELAARKVITQIGGTLLADGQGVDLTSGRMTVGDKQLAKILTLSNLKILRVDGAGITDLSLPLILQYRDSLTDLMLVNTSFSSDAFKKLAAMPKLTTLDIRGASQLDDTVVPAIANNHSIKALALLGATITDKGLAKIATMKQLLSLDLRSCNGLKAAGMLHLRTLPNLKVLKLSGETVNDKTLAALFDDQEGKSSELKDLKGLTLEICYVSDEGLKKISSLPLESLTLFDCSSVSDEGLKILTSFSDLKTLSLRKIYIMEPFLQHLKSPEKLKNLLLMDCGINAEVLAGIEKCTSLEKLNLHFNIFEPPLFNLITGLPSLKTVLLNETQMNSEKLKVLADSFSIVELSLSSNYSLDGSAVEPLSKMTKLQKLSVKETGMSPEDIAKLQKLLPECAIESQ